MSSSSNLAFWFLSVICVFSFLFVYFFSAFEKPRTTEKLSSRRAAAASQFFRKKNHNKSAVSRKKLTFSKNLLVFVWFGFQKWRKKICENVVTNVGKRKDSCCPKISEKISNSLRGGKIIINFTKFLTNQLFGMRDMFFQIKLTFLVQFF